MRIPFLVFGAYGHMEAPRPSGTLDLFLTQNFPKNSVHLNNPV
jgi:hypothetical protein